MYPENRTRWLFVAAAAALATTLSAAIALAQTQHSTRQPGPVLSDQLPDQPSGSQPFVFAATLANGKKVGDLVLGATTLKQAVKMFPKTVGQGKPRPNPVEFNVSGRTLKPLTVYNPSQTMYQLYFDAKERLVLIVDGAPEPPNMQKNELLARYPQLKESKREAFWSEMQAELQPCVTLIAVFQLPDEKLDSLGYAFTCVTK